MLGEQLKPLLAGAVQAHGVSVFKPNSCLPPAEKCEREVTGAVAYNLRTQRIYHLSAHRLL